jgi:thiol-disulfide isomerase/thioredoxin
VSETKQSNAVTVTIFVAALIAGFALLPRLLGRGGGMVGKDAPEFTVGVILNANPAVEGKPTLSLSELRGKAVLLDFWASWCGPCQAEAPIVNRVAARYKDKGLVVLGLNTSDDESTGKAWATMKNLRYPIVYDQGNKVADGYGVRSLPTIIMVSRTGKITAVRSGITDDAELESIIKQAL